MIIEEIDKEEDLNDYEVNDIAKTTDNSLLLDKLAKITLNDVSSEENLQMIRGSVANNKNTNIKTLSELQKLNNNWINLCIINNISNYDNLQIVKEIVKEKKDTNIKSVVINMYAQLDSIFTILNSLDFTNIDDETKKYLEAIEKMKLL